MNFYKIKNFNFYFKWKNILLNTVNLNSNYNIFFVRKLNKNYFFKNKYISLFLFSKIDFLNFFIKNSKNQFLKVNELELKGLNYWFSKLKSNLVLDLGWSHFQILSYPNENFFFSLKKKKIKKIFFLGFKKTYFNSIISFFWYKLKSIGPYKLKGFQFLNEWIKLKEGKKPFK